MTRPADAPASMDEREFDVDLGDDHWLHFTVADDGRKTGARVTHRCTRTESGWDQGFVLFDIPDNPHAAASPKWQVESWDPLTLSPSLLQRGCGDHGFIQGGKWVRA
jgi:hypothetical protein